MTEILDDLFAIHYDVLGVPGHYPEGHPIVKYRTSRKKVWNALTPSEQPVSPVPANQLNPSWTGVYPVYNPGYWGSKEYLISSLGPDKDEDLIPAYAFNTGYQVNAEFYSPTNGTKSSGDLVFSGP